MKKRRSQNKMNRYWYLSIAGSFIFLVAMVALYVNELQTLDQIRQDFRSTHTNLFIEKK